MLHKKRESSYPIFSLDKKTYFIGSFFEVEIVMSCEITVGFESGSHLLDEVNNLSTQCSN